MTFTFPIQMCITFSIPLTHHAITFTSFLFLNHSFFIDPIFCEILISHDTN